MKKLSLLLLMWIPAMCLPQHSNGQSAEFKPENLEFVRQASRRMIFDSSQNIPLAGLVPDKIIGLDLMHPPMGSQQGEAKIETSGKLLKISADSSRVTSTRWVGGFNPFATYEVDLRSFEGTGRVGLKFLEREKENYLLASISVRGGKYHDINWEVVKDGEVIDRQQFEWPESLAQKGPVKLRVQMLAVGVNIYLESSGETVLVGHPDFNQHFELRRKRRLHRFQFCLYSQLEAGAQADIAHVHSALTPGCGQADIRAITTSTGKPLLDDGRIWLTMTVRGRALPHPMQGVFSLNPSVFDIRFEGIIVFDMGDGLWRNELASHIFFDEQAKQWRGWTTGFSAFGTAGKKEEKAILAVWSDRDPRKGFSVMQARPIGIQGEHEDPHGVYDTEAKKWRLLLSERAGKYRAGMWESDAWDRGFQRLAGPVEMDSTGTLIQEIEGVRYALFGSADRKVYIRSYPNLEPVGELKMHLPPWNEGTGTRIWPNVIPLPAGYPAPYIALMMDRQNFPNMPRRNWTYGAMYLYHAHP